MKKFMLLPVVIFLCVLAPLSAGNLRLSGYGGSYYSFLTPLNYFSTGVIAQAGIELGTGNILKTAVLGEVGGGLGIPFLLEYDLGGNVELYILRIGVGGGYGLAGNLVKWIDTDKDSISTPYIRFSLLYNDFYGLKLALFGEVSKRENWDFAGKNWGIGFVGYVKLF